MTCIDLTSDEIGRILWSMEYALANVNRSEEESQSYRTLMRKLENAQQQKTAAPKAGDRG